MSDVTAVDTAVDDAVAADPVDHDEVAGTPAAAPRRPLTDRLTVPRVVLVAAVLLYVSYYTRRSLDLHHGLATSTYDSALYDQGMWLLSRGEAPFVTLMGRNLFGDHSSFILLFLVPFYWIAPGAWIMFTAQSAAIGLGAVPVFLYGRRRLGSEWWALVGAGAYLLHPAVGWTNLENFHPDAFLGVLVGFAIYAALEAKWRMYAVFVVLSLLVKEDVSLVIVPLGIWVALRRDRRIGLLTIAGSLAFMAVAMFLVMRSLIGVPTRNSWRIPFGGPRGVVDTAVTNPTALAEHLTNDGRPWYLWQMTAPFAWLFARLPSVALISALVLFTNILSTFWYQYQIQYHYGLVAVPALALGTVHAIGAVKERRAVRAEDDHGVERRMWIPTRGLALVTLALVVAITSYMWAPVPWGRTPQYYGVPDGELAVTARELMAEVPDDAVVAAHYRITPHLAYRTEIYQFPTPFRVVLYGADDRIEGTRLDDRAERVEYVMIPTSQDAQLVADWASISVAFDEIGSNERWLLFRRDRTVELPPLGSG